MELLVRKKISRIETVSAHLWTQHSSLPSKNSLQSIENALLKELEKKLLDDVVEKLEGALPLSTVKKKEKGVQTHV